MYYLDGVKTLSMNYRVSITATCTHDLVVLLAVWNYSLDNLKAFLASRERVHPGPNLRDDVTTSPCCIINMLIKIPRPFLGSKNLQPCMACRRPHLIKQVRQLSESEPDSAKLGNITASCVTSCSGAPPVIG